MIETEISGSKLELVEGDITEQDTEAIVNAANKRLAPGGGVAGAIYRAAGPELYEECKEIDGCETGKAVITKGYELEADYVIHTVGPVYSGSEEDPKLLAESYENSLKLAEEEGIESVSFPAISTGAFGYPVKEAAKVVLRTINRVLENLDLKLVRIVLYSEEDYKMWKEKFEGLQP